MQLRRKWPPGTSSTPATPSFILLLATIPAASSLHHMKRDPLYFVKERDSDLPLRVTNQCPEAIYPGIATQAGTAPTLQGFRLAAGETKNLTVSADWQGRVWGRTNCTFNPEGTGPANSGGVNGGGAACMTGDCNGIVDCRMTGQTPVSLAEFTLASSSGQAFYDISLVDGYNLPVAIVALFGESSKPNLQDIPPNLTNPVCIGTAALLGDPGSTEDQTLGSNDTYPLPLEQTQTREQVQRWCPWDLQQSPPAKPGDGVYPYPDDNIQRPLFNPCLSACAKWNNPWDCCTEYWDSPDKCQPSIYSQNSKSVCPDAYSYAFDDQTSTFIVPMGGGFQVIFCPPGRSTTILQTLGDELRALAATGKVTPRIVSQASNKTYIEETSEAELERKPPGSSSLALCIALLGLTAGFGYIW